MDKKAIKSFLWPVLIVIPFAIGLLGSSTSLTLMIFGLFYSTVIVLVLGVVMVIRLAKQKGPKGVLLGLLFFAVLVPLVFGGSCLLAAAGQYLKGILF